MTPRADFTCLSKKCATPEGAPVYELPVGATRCPVCGSKRVQRIWTAPHISRGIARHVDALAGPGHEHQLDNRDSARRHEGAVRRADAWERFGMQVGPAANLGALAAKAMGMPAMAALSAGPAKSARAEGVSLGQPLAAPKIAHEVGPMISGRHPRPAPGSLSDKGRP